MTLRKNDFETGTNAATITTGNSAGAGVDAFSGVTIGATSAVIYDNTHAAHGTLAAKCTTGSGEVTNVLYSGLSITDGAVSAYFYLTALPAIDTFLFRFTVAGTRKASIHVNSAGKLRMSDSLGTSGIWTSTNTIPLNQWVRIEFRAQSTATSATFTAAYYLGDATSSTEGSTVTTANGGGTAFDAITIGKTDSGTYTTPYWMDSIQVQDAATGLIGPYPVSAASSVRPNANITNTGPWTNQGGAASIEAALADELDATYAQSPANPASAVLTEAFPPLATGNVTVIVRAAVTGASPAIGLTIELLQGTTVIASWSVATLSTSATDYSNTTTAPQTANITDRTQLRVRLTTV